MEDLIIAAHADAKDKVKSKAAEELSKKGNNTNNGIYIFPLENGIYELYRSVYTDQKLDCYASGFYIKPQNYPDGIFRSDLIK